MTDTPKRKPVDPSFGVRLRAARKRAGLSLEGLAKRIGMAVTRQALSKYEKGRMMPSPDVLALLEKALDIRPPGPLLIPQQGIEEDVRYLCVSDEMVKKLSDETVIKGAVEEEIDIRAFAPRKSVLSSMSRRLRDIDRHTLRREEFIRREEVAVKGEIPPHAAEPGFAALAERRARYARAWESGTGPDRIRFREGEKLPAKSVSTLKHRLADHLERYLGLESLLGLTAAFENPAAGMSVRTAEDVEAASAEVRRRWELGSGPIVNLLGVLEDRGIRVFETAGIEGFEGLSGTFGTVPFVAVSRDLPVDRVRFTAAHELAHLVGRFPEREEAEGLCHGFAWAFLLPKPAVEKAFGGPGRKVTLGALAEIKTTYGISLQAIMHRAKGLGLVSERQFRAFRETVKAKGWAVTEPVEYPGAERAARFRRLVHYAVAADILDLERAAQVAGVPVAELRDEIGEIF